MALSSIEINGNILATTDHPFMVGGIWKKAGDLLLGDALDGRTGDAILVQSINRISKGVRAYNLTVDDPHTFYAQGVLVQNKDPIPGM